MPTPTRHYMVIVPAGADPAGSAFSAARMDGENECEALTGTTQSRPAARSNLNRHRRIDHGDSAKSALTPAPCLHERPTP